MAKPKRIIMALCIAVVFLQVSNINLAHAEEVTIDEGDVAISVSPMRESVVLNPGDEYRSSFIVTNPGVVLQDLHYKIEIQPFYVDENYRPVYDEKNNNNQIVDWITFDSPTKGTIHPNNSDTIEYTVKVPENAPAGGQYASITVSTDIDQPGSSGININESLAMAHLLLAEVTGNSVTSGEILDAGIDSFLLGRVIRVYSSVQNTGNVHSLATYNMKVSPIFSDQVLYDTSADPETHYILPDRTLHNESYWYDTPMIGIFDVLYTVEFQGITTEVSRIVIVCPWWLLIIILLLVIILIVRIVTLIRLKREKTEQTKTEIG